MMSQWEKAETIRRGVHDYLGAKHGPGDVSWHPLFVAALDLYAFLLEPDLSWLTAETFAEENERCE